MTLLDELKNYFFPALVLAGLAGILWFVLKQWRKVAEVYPCLQPCYGNRCYFRSGIIAGANINGFLIIGADLRGVYFSSLFPLSLFAPPLMIPWEELTGVEHKGILSRSVELTFARMEDIRNEIPGRLADKLEEASGGVWHFERADRSVTTGRD